MVVQPENNGCRLDGKRGSEAQAQAPAQSRRRRRAGGPPQPASMPPADPALLAPPPAALETAAAPACDAALRRTLLSRTLPICCLLTAVTYIDRSNLGLAAPMLIADGIVSRLTFGWAASAFFLTYGVLQLPMSTVFTTKLGMSRWFAVTVGAWGATTAATSLVRGPGELVFLRLLLGAFEAGTLPGCYCLLSRFHTVREGWRRAGSRGVGPTRPARPAPPGTLPPPSTLQPSRPPPRLQPSAMAIIYPTMLTFTLLAGVVGGPLGAGLIKMDGVGGLRGWRWLFLIEGLATVALAAALPWLVPESIGKSSWLTADEKEAAAADVTAAARAAGVRAPETGIGAAGAQAPADAETLASALATAARVLGVWQIWCLGAAVILCQCAFWVLVYYVPLEIASAFGAATAGAAGGDAAAVAARSADAALKSALVFLPAAAALVASGALVRRTGERKWSCAAWLALSAVGFGLLPAAGGALGPSAGLAALALAAVGESGAMAALSTWPAPYLAPVRETAGGREGGASALRRVGSGRVPGRPGRRAGTAGEGGRAGRVGARRARRARADPAVPLSPGGRPRRRRVRVLQLVLRGGGVCGTAGAGRAVARRGVLSFGRPPARVSCRPARVWLCGGPFTPSQGSGGDRKRVTRGGKLGPL